jgi:hypothetical protein
MNTGCLDSLIQACKHAYIVQTHTCKQAVWESDKLMAIHRQKETYAHNKECLHVTVTKEQKHAMLMMLAISVLNFISTTTNSKSTTLFKLLRCVFVCCV